MLDVIILTKNEAQDIEACIQSLHWAASIWVLDSGSIDETVTLASKAGAQIAYNTFYSFGQQRNYALDHLDIKSEWVLFLDADEQSTPAFEKAVKEAIINANVQIAGFYCCWKMILEGRWLKRCDNFPKWQFRLLRKDRARFTDFGHGQKEGIVQGTIDYIKEPYLHYGFSKGWTHWIDRHNKYASLEAVARLEKRPPFKNMLSGTGSIRNPALKAWLSHIPGWPLLRFAQAYFLSLGFLEGRQGLVYCVNMAYYEFLIKIKMKELIIKKNYEDLSLNRIDLQNPV